MLDPAKKKRKEKKKKAKTLSKGAEAKVHKRTQKWLDPRERGGGGGGEKAMICFQMFFQPAGGHTRWQEIIGRCTFHIINP